MLKRKLSILTALLTLSVGSLFAFVHPNYEKGECWGVGAEYLYWRQDVDSTIFATSSNAMSTVDGTIYDVQWGFKSGFRVEGAYAIDCTDEVHVRYTRLGGSESRTVDGDPYLWQSVGAAPPQSFGAYIGYATGNLSSTYQSGDVLYSSRVWDSCGGSHFYVFGGLQYYNFRSKEKYNFVDTVSGVESIITFTSHLYGIGPEFGFEFYRPLDLCWCGWEEMNLALVGQASASLLAQRSNTGYSDTLGGFTFESPHINGVWRIIPAFNARAGLAYNSTCWCLDFDLEIGYEFTTYVRSLGTVYDPIGYALFEHEFSGVNLQGLYVALGVAF